MMRHLYLFIGHLHFLADTTIPRFRTRLSHNHLTSASSISLYIPSDNIHSRIITLIAIHNLVDIVTKWTIFCTKYLHSTDYPMYYIVYHLSMVISLR